MAMTQEGERRILITGGAGFVGRKLAERLRRDLPRASIILCDLVAGESPAGPILPLNVANEQDVKAIVRDVQPTSIVHLAAVSAVASSFADPRQAWDINVMGTLNIVLALEQFVPTCHLLFISSAEVYGRSTYGGDPVDETALLLPANPYAATKAAADLLVQEASHRTLRSTIVRPFNHTGPGQAPNFAVPAFCRQIAMIEKGLQEPKLMVGELNDERDFTDVSDMIDLYVRIVTRERELPNSLVLNAASAIPRRIGDVLDSLLKAAHVPIDVEVDPSKLRATRVPRVVGNSDLAKKILGWQAQKPFSETLEDTLSYWRAQV